MGGIQAVMNLPLFLLAASEPPEHSGTSSPFVSVLICWGNKGKTLFNSQSQVGNYVPFLFLVWEGFFFFKSKESICPSPKIQNGFQGWRWEKKSCPYCTEGFSPLSIPKAGDKIQQFFLQKTNAESIRRIQGTAWGLHNHTLPHRLCAHLLTPKICCKTFCSVPCLFFLTFLRVYLFSL